MKKLLPLSMLIAGCSADVPTVVSEEDSTGMYDSSESTGDASTDGGWNPQLDIDFQPNPLLPIEECFDYTYPTFIEELRFTEQMDQFVWSGAQECDYSTQPFCERSLELGTIISELEPSHDMTHLLMNKGIANGVNMYALANDHIIQNQDAWFVIHRAWENFYRIKKDPTSTCDLDELIFRDLLVVMDPNSDFNINPPSDYQASSCPMYALTLEEQTLALKKAESTIMFVLSHELSHLLHNHNDQKYCMYELSDGTDEERLWENCKFEAEADEDAISRTLDYCTPATVETDSCIIEPESGLMVYRIFKAIEDNEFPWQAQAMRMMSDIVSENTYMQQNGSLDCNYTHPTTDYRIGRLTDELIDNGYTFLVDEFNAVN